MRRLVEAHMTVEQDTLDRLTRIAKDRRVPRAVVVREALEAYLQSPAGAECAAPSIAPPSNTAVPAPAGRPSARASRWGGKHPWSGRSAMPRSEYRGAKTEAT